MAGPDEEEPDDTIVAVVDDVPDEVLAIVADDPAAVDALIADWQGMRGPRGIQGETGPQGPKGETGLIGPEGPRGFTGGTGQAGPQGVQGERGFKGGTGDAGPKGDRGEVGPQGNAGERGLTGAGAGAAAELPKWSRGPLSAGSVVRLYGADHCVPVSALDPLDALVPIGVVHHAVSAAEVAVSVLVYGEHDDDTWNWTPGAPLFVGPTGLLTQTPSPAWAFLRIVGTAVTSTLAFIDPQPPIMLAAGV